MRTLVSSVAAGAGAALLLTVSACTSNDDGVETVEPAEAVQLIDEGEHTVIDVRTPAEYAAGHVEGALNLDLTAGSFAKQVEGLDKAEDYLLYCQSGNRSAVAAEKLADLGFSGVVDAGGVLSLEAAGASVVAAE